MRSPPRIESLAGVCEVSWEGPAGGAPDYLIEMPHGATARAHFDATRARLVGDFPPNLVDYFFVNTDVGAPECAREIARSLAASGACTLVLRCLVPRTFIDCNRIVTSGSRGGEMSPGIAEYVRDEEDRRTLYRLYQSYQEQAREAFRLVCEAGGLALTLHTYAPRSVHVERYDEGIVAALHEAYEPERYASWPRRPDVDVISEDPEGHHLAPPGIVARLQRGFAAIGVEAAENATYRLHPETLGHVRSATYPGQVLCLELNRELLAAPFVPFAEMRIDRDQVARLTAPIVDALRAQVAPRHAG